MNIIIDFQYFPPSILFKSLFQATHLFFEQYENFQKMTFRNRLMIAGGNGPVLLTIPLRHGRNQKRVIKDVQIDNRIRWQDNHWKTIVSCYNKSPWFEFYFDELRDLFTTDFDLLIDWDLFCFEWTCKKLDLTLPVSMTDTWKGEHGDSEWKDLRNKFSPKSLNNAVDETPWYRQVFEDRTGFIPNLSILDLLFCEGKNARNLLSQR